jgi:hypothetical protein
VQLNPQRLGHVSVSALGACPLCREVLAPDTGGAVAQLCPACGADLKPYIELYDRAAQYISLCRELLSRGELLQASTIIEQLTTITEIDPAVIAELNARRELTAGQPEAAAIWLQRCSLNTQAMLRHELQRQRHLQQTALELYNYALTAARRGEYRLAAEQAQRATVLAPGSPEIWQLKLKADVKCGYIARCYDDLRALDQLGARPPHLGGLERLLPPVA